MKALILRQDPDAADVTSRALIDKGFQILCVSSLAVAHALIRVDTIDLLVMDERIDGQLTHAIALSGERRSPYLSTIMMTDRHGEETDDLYELIPCLYALAGMQTSAHVLGQLALCAVSNQDEAVARVNRRNQQEALIAAVIPENGDAMPAILDRAPVMPVRALNCAGKSVFARRIDRESAEFAAIFRSDPVMQPPAAHIYPQPEIA